jgi:small subunit ribosomal protein S16
MSVVIRLMRAGAKKRPFYRVVAADSRRQRDGRFLEILGHYNPLADPYELVLQKERVEAWLNRGAQPSDQVGSLLRSQGMRWGKPSASKKKKPVVADSAAPKAAKKKATKKAAPRKVSARKAQKKVARKTTPAKPKAKKAKKR